MKAEYCTHKFRLNMVLRHFLLLMLISILLPLGVNGQKIELSGTVLGYSGDQLKVIRKVQKNVRFEGMLSHVGVRVYQNSTLIAQTNTDNAGNFAFEISDPGQYKIYFHKPGYRYVQLELNYVGNEGPDMYPGFSLLLKEQEDADTLLVGNYTIDKGTVSFTPSKSNPDPVKENDLANNISFCVKASSAINHLRNNISAPEIEYITKYVRIRDTVRLEPEVVEDTVVQDSSIVELMNTILEMDINEDNLSQWSSYLDSAKIALAQLDTGSTAYKDLKEKIEFAEQKLQSSQDIISLKERELDQANKKILYISLFAVFLGLFLVLLAFLLYQRKKHLKLVKEKNEKITRINSNIMSSIRYAGLIQNNFLDSPDAIVTLFDHAFVYYKPKEIVSGDFYWFGKHKGHSIIVAADCTGHGVPGAMLTVLGHSAINNIVYEKGIVSPSDILRELNNIIIETFDNYDDYMPHGMDVSIVSIEADHKSLKFCGAMNGIYIVRGEDVMSHRAILRSLGTEISDDNLVNTTVDLQSNDLVVLFSDGYYDQFKGGQKKVEKYNVRRFKRLLTEVSKISPEAAKVRFENELNEWKGSAEQIDDILIVGFKV